MLIGDCKGCVMVVRIEFAETFHWYLGERTFASRWRYGTALIVNGQRKMIAALFDTYSSIIGLIIGSIS